MNTEFERAQQDPEYLAWLEVMDSELNRFLAEDAPEIGKLDDSYTAERQALCEQAIRDRFGRGQAIADPVNAEMADRFTRYIGEVHRRATEARWVNAGRMSEGAAIRPQLLFPFSEYSFDPCEQIGSAFAADPQLPSELVWVLNNMLEEHTRRVGFGRPSVDEYWRLYLERLVAETDGNDL
ncbi:hypothetical protein [Nocardia carnea]|uniref:hypothetical protein n=1 Tax=Nocardia carnea TaxID=37328 RepID=UPI002456E7E3|nr:hypothetical protein [Nocardia carnea]